MSKGISPASQAAYKAWATRRNKIVPAGDVINAIVDGKRNTRQLLNQYVARQVQEGKDERRIRAAIKAHVTRRKNQEV